ncbi:TonB system transport protein ExbD [Rhodovulum sp. DZ06]|uniref:TonB system transport protein ExbD n=1 Tax=Rhodovulum sp. DZ06 TaxID=3425126 RepID=UPI003D3470D5
MAGPIRDSDEALESAEINITPFIDVMLVLLIIFMVAAPLSTVDVPVELPVSNAEAAARPSDPVFLTLREDGQVSVGDRDVPLAALVQEVEIVTKLDRDARLYLRADRAVPYGELMGVLNKLRVGGYLKVGLVGLEVAEGGA